jgi:ABC-type branched-subunit amino acid transport system ATPase component
MFRIIKIEFNRHLNRWTIAAMLVFLLLGTIILQVGIDKHKIDLKHQEEFINTEMKKVLRYINYHQVGIFGFRRLLEPIPLAAAFYNSITLNELLAFIDNGVRLKHMELKVGKNLFEKPFGGSLDLSWYFLIFGSLAISAWGFFALRNIQFLRYLMNFTGEKNVYWGIILARIIMIFLFLAAAFLLYRLQYLINGMGLDFNEITGLLTFFLMTALVWVFFLGLSTACGAIRDWRIGAVILGVLWILLVLIWPEVLSVIVSKKAAATMKSAYKHEIRKIEKLMEFEKEAFEYSGRYKTREEKIEADKRMGEKWWDKDFKEIEKLEAEMFEKTREIARSFQSWNIFNPVTHYKSVNNELSSRGYNAYLEFYRENQEIHKGFLRYYLDKKRYESYTKVVPYLSKEQLVSRSKVSLPAYFVPGLILNLAIIAGVLFLAYLRFNRSLFPVPEKGVTTENAVFTLTKGMIFGLIMYCLNLKNQFLNVFYGCFKEFRGKITIDGQNIVTREKKRFVYIPCPSRIYNATRIRHLLSLASKVSVPGIDIKKKVFGDLKDLEKARLLLAIAQSIKTGIIILDDFAEGLASDFEYTEIVREIKSDDNLIISLSSNNSMFVIPDKTIITVRRGSGYVQDKDLLKGKS